MDLKILLGTFLFGIIIRCINSYQYPREVLDCYANNNNPYYKFGTKTAYDFVYERRKVGEPGIQDCTPVLIWMLARHGTRYPTRNEIRGLLKLKDFKSEIIRNHEDRKNGKLCYADVENLKKWTFNVTMADAGMLTQQGEKDLYFLAQRIKTKFPELFKQDYSPGLYQFRTTDSERTRQSARDFADGLFGPSAGVWIPNPAGNDSIIKPYSNCSSWNRRVMHNPMTFSEAQLFKMTPEVTNLIHNVSQRLGFMYDLQLDIILAMYDMCRFDKAWAISHRSPWCAAFIKNELLILEYINDLENYYDSGFGHYLNLKLGCVPLKDMIEKFTDMETGSRGFYPQLRREMEFENFQSEIQPAGVFYFTHRHMLLMTLARLGIAGYGLPLRHDNYDLQHKREWRSSDLAPFAGNLMAVFYKCNSGEYNRVMFFLNEKRIDYEGCEVGLCSWSYIRNKFADIPLHCNLDWCNSGPRLQILIIPLILFILLHQYL